MSLLRPLLLCILGSNGVTVHEYLFVIVLIKIRSVVIVSRPCVNLFDMDILTFGHLVLISFQSYQLIS